MVNGKPPIALFAADAPIQAKRSNYPEPFASRVASREKRQLGDLFRLTHYGVNLTCLPPGCISALRHAHLAQDEFVYVLEGHPVLVTDEGDTALSPGMCAGFRAGAGNAHHLINRTDTEVRYLEIGDRNRPEVVTYPDDDIHGSHDPEGRWGYSHKDGKPY